MKLEDVTAEIRPRSPWEAVDLGCVLVRAHFGRLLAAWCVTILPLCLLILGLLHNHIPVAIVIIWWLKPLFDHVPLFYLSQALFGSPPSLDAVLKEWPRIIGRHLLEDFATLPLIAILILSVYGIIDTGSATAILSFGITALIVLNLARRRGRFIPWRSFLLPLIDLEKLKGHAYRNRSRVLGRQGAEQATWLTALCAFMELVVLTGAFFLVLSFIPEGQGPDWTGLMSDYFALDNFQLPIAAWWTIAGLYLLAMSLVEIFYVGAGFGLYLNSRTLLEGWDVELSFRKLAGRLQDSMTSGINTAATVLLLPLALALVVVVASPASAEKTKPEDAPAPPQEALLENDTETPEGIIKTVLEDPDFEIHSVNRTIFVPDETDGTSLNLSWLDFVGELIFWGVIIATLVGLGLLIYHNRHLFTRRPSSGGGAAASRPRARTIMGMDILSESLPDDIAGAAWEAWQAGDYQRAVSLLYRGAICWLVEREDLPILESDTEGDCVRHAAGMPHAPHVRYFSDLTGKWVRIAYGKETLSAEDVHDLCQNWPFDLRQPSSASQTAPPST